MYEWITLYAHQRAAQLRQDREKQRIVQLALAAGAKREAWYAPVLAWLGRQFLAWGADLQMRYDHAEAPAAQ
jgi:hypothetical protein